MPCIECMAQGLLGGLATTLVSTSCLRQNSTLPPDAKGSRMGLARIGRTRTVIVLMTLGLVACVGAELVSAQDFAKDACNAAASASESGDLDDLQSAVDNAEFAADADASFDPLLEALDQLHAAATVGNPDLLLAAVPEVTAECNDVFAEERQRFIEEELDRLN